MPTVTQWSVNRGKAENEIRSGHPYGLRNTDNNRYVIYGEREYGINLVWRSEFWRAMWFQRQDPASGPIRYGDRCAIAFAYGGAYVRYGNRRWGINLVWSATPAFEWHLTGGNTGSRIRYQGNKFGIFNEKANDHLVHCVRTWGINLSWEHSCKAFDDEPTEATVSVNCKIPLAGDGTQSSFGTVAFTGQMTTAHGATGDTTFNKTDQWEAPMTADEALSGITVGGLRPGVWRIEARTPLWVAACTVDLDPGVNEWVNFVEQVEGCARGFTFPGATAMLQPRPQVKDELEAPPTVEDLPDEGLEDPAIAKVALPKRTDPTLRAVDRDLEPMGLAPELMSGPR
jgi:hypothetical protein